MLFSQLQDGIDHREVPPGVVGVERGCAAQAQAPLAVVGLAIPETVGELSDPTRRQLVELLATERVPAATDLVQTEDGAEGVERVVLAAFGDDGREGCLQVPDEQGVPPCLDTLTDGVGEVHLVPDAPVLSGPLPPRHRVRPVHRTGRHRLHQAVHRQHVAVPVQPFDGAAQLQREVACGPLAARPIDLVEGPPLARPCLPSRRDLRHAISSVEQPVDQVESAVPRVPVQSGLIGDGLPVLGQDLLPPRLQTEPSQLGLHGDRVVEAIGVIQPQHGTVLDGEIDEGAIHPQQDAGVLLVPRQPAVAEEVALVGGAVGQLDLIPVLPARLGAALVLVRAVVEDAVEDARHVARVQSAEQPFELGDAAEGVGHPVGHHVVPVGVDTIPAVGLPRVAVACRLADLPDVQAATGREVVEVGERLGHLPEGQVLRTIHCVEGGEIAIHRFNPFGLVARQVCPLCGEGLLTPTPRQARHSSTAFQAGDACRTCPC